MTLNTWGHYPKFMGHGPSFKGSWRLWEEISSCGRGVPFRPSPPLSGQGSPGRQTHRQRQQRGAAGHAHPELPQVGAAEVRGAAYAPSAAPNFEKKAGKETWEAPAPVETNENELSN